MNNYKEALNHLSLLKLNGIKSALDSEINEAEAGKLSYLNFLIRLLKSETDWRSNRRLQRNMAAAHFPSEKSLEAFEFDGTGGITQTDISNLLDFKWLDNHSNLLFFGAPGLGKTHISIALGLKAIRSGYKVYFERMTNLTKLLKTSEIQRSSSFRINRLLKGDLVIIDEIGYTPIDRKEANLFFNLVSELYEKCSIIITSNKSFDEWAEMMGDEIMTTALLDRLLHHSRIFKLSGPSYRLKAKSKSRTKQ